PILPTGRAGSESCPTAAREAASGEPYTMSDAITATPLSSTALAEPRLRADTTVRDTAPSSPLVHFWAVLTVCATFCLLALGGILTTFRVGMAAPVWPTSPWPLLLISWDEPSAGFLIEHTHRLAGYIVGCCIIVLTAGLWLGERRRWMSWLGTLALAAV